jgi:hypothetical protein
VIIHTARRGASLAKDTAGTFIVGVVSCGPKHGAGGPGGQGGRRMKHEQDILMSRCCTPTVLKILNLGTHASRSLILPLPEYGTKARSNHEQERNYMYISMYRTLCRHRGAEFDYRRYHIY